MRWRAMQGAECIENGDLENGLRRMRTKHWEEKAPLMGDILRQPWG